MCSKRTHCTTCCRKQGKGCKRGEQGLESWKISDSVQRPIIWYTWRLLQNYATKTTSLFDNRCDNVLNAFSMKWKSSCKCQYYIMTFTTKRWRKLTVNEKARHTLKNCIACAIQHAQLQGSFPGPTFTPDLKSMYSTASIKKWWDRHYAMWTVFMRYIHASDLICILHVH